MLDVLRQATRIDFWASSTSQSHSSYALPRWLGVDAEVKVSERKCVAALKKARKEYQSFEVKVIEEKERYRPELFQLSVTIYLRDGFEWKNAWEEAWTHAESPNPHCLSDNAFRLYEWARGPKNSFKMTERNKLGAQARLRGTYSHIEEHLKEIQLKAAPDLQWEMAEGSWHGPVRIWFDKSEACYYHFGPLNPALGLKIRNIAHCELERFKNWLNAEAQKPGFPDGTETVGIFDIRDRKTLNACFQYLPAYSGPKRTRFQSKSDKVPIQSGQSSD